MTSANEILMPAPTQKTCRECGQGFQIEFAVFAKWVEVCPACSERQAIADQKRVIRRDSWKAICPPAFYETLPHKLPQPSKLQIVLAWQYGPIGLLLHGETGQGKSRCAWQLVKREFAAGRRIRVLDATLAFDYGERFAKSCAEASDWIRQLIEVDLLLLDDPFKSKLSDSLEQALFAVVNGRMEHKRPIIVTTNDVGETLLARMSSDRGPALVRRLRECCRAIAF